MSKVVKSKRALMRELFKKHPDWTYKQYSEALGIDVTYIRSYSNILLNEQRKKERAAEAEERAKRASKDPKPTKKVGLQQVSSSSTRSRSSGYLKLI